MRSEERGQRSATEELGIQLDFGDEALHPLVEHVDQVPPRDRRLKAGWQTCR